MGFNNENHFGNKHNHIRKTTMMMKTVVAVAVTATAWIDETQEELYYEVNFWKSIRVYTIHSLYLTLAPFCGIENSFAILFFLLDSLTIHTYAIRMRRG